MIKKIICYINEYKKNISIAILASSFFAFSIFPLIFKAEISIATYLGITSLTVLFIISSWDRTKSFWQRLKNTHKLEKPPFVYPHYIGLFLTFSIIFTVIYFFVFQVKPFHKPSSEFIGFAIINCFLILGWLLLTCFGKVKKDEEHPLNSETYSLSDEPIQSVEQDLLGREKFIEDLYQEIVNLPFSDSFVFGLHGSWGEGKTSVINLLKNKLKVKENFLIVNFDPWFFKNEEAILAAFYQQVEQAISQRFIFPNIKKIFTKYQKLISSGLSHAGIKINLTETGESLEKIRQKIESYIVQIEKKIVIFIDDIDRLQPEEIMLVFKIVRLNANFKNTRFVLSFDYSATTKKIDPITGEKAEDYISKIIQQPIILPKIEQSYLNKFLLYSDHPIPEYRIPDLISTAKKGIKVSTCGIIHEINDNFLKISEEVDRKQELIVTKITNKELLQKTKLRIGDEIFVEGMLEKDGIVVVDRDGQIIRYRLSKIDLVFYEILQKDKINNEDIKRFDDEFISFYRSQLSRLILTLRDAKRYINSLYISLPAIAEEVNIEDFCLLEFIKVFQIELYNDIYENWWFYVEERKEDEHWFHPFGIHFPDQKEKKSQVMEQHIDDFLKRHVNNPIKKDILKKILVHLFPNIKKNNFFDYNGARRKKKICSTAFLKYFILKVPSNELSDRYIETIIKALEISDNSEKYTEKVFFELQKKNKLIELFEKIPRVYLPRISKKTAFILIKTIKKNTDKFSQKGTEGLLSSEFDVARFLIVCLINNKVEKDNIQNVIEDVISKTPNLPFAVHTVLSCKKERGGELFNIYDSIKIDEIQGLVAERLKKHFVDGNKDIFSELKEERDWAFVLYQWATNWMTFKGDNNRIVNSYVLSLIRDDSKKCVKFIMHQFQRTDSNTRAYDLEKLDKIYDIEKLKDLAEKHKDSDVLNQEEIEAIKKFIEAYSLFLKKNSS